jgi:predicted Ser/Thr protein kinase
MPSCAACSTQLTATTRFCPQCGTSANTADPDSVETVAVSFLATNMAGMPSRADERFPPGMLLASRYRVVSRVGKGGMGEVFRADDLMLGQPVALKFLPEAARGNVNLLKRFYDEVRIARQISHKNVCRVYDIGEIDGHPYLSMEYIDGEDLGSLLRRIGRLPADKAAEFARKMCAGIAAAHAQGVLHRDIKPANIMIDSRGELRITDFGLAGLADQLQGTEIRNGTPAYMAPEQLTGQEVSVQSDLYAVGLVLYEMFTGKLPFTGNTVAEVTKMRQENRVTNPSTLVNDLDKTVERAILRCLDADPRQRPASALALAGSLPGGDPLAAALADGETPSPEAVAAAGSTEGLNPRIAVSALAAFVLGLVVFFVFQPRLAMINRIPMENPPEVLASKARDIAKSLGYSDRPADTAAGFFQNGDYLLYLRAKVKGDELRRLVAQPPVPLEFWYRQSPRLLVTDHGSGGEVTADDPFPSLPGMIQVNTDLDGRLRHFAATPPERETEPAPKGPVDWTPLFTAAGIDPAMLQSAQPEWTPLGATDVRAAWTGHYPGRTDLPVRVEAASFHGRAVFFDLVWPWKKPARTPAEAGLSSTVQLVLVMVFLLAAAAVARYNWKAGRSDSRSAVRIGLYCAGTSLLTWALSAHHVASSDELGLATEAGGDAAFLFAVFWLIYLALEPWVRRYWPQTMITWSRLMAGRWRDPLVGRDILFGSVCGVAYCLLIYGYHLVALHLGDPQFSDFHVPNLIGARASAGWIARRLSNAVAGGPQLFLVLFVLRLVLRRQWLAALAFVLIFAASDLANDDSSVTIASAVIRLLIYGILVLIMLRLGFFALMVTMFVVNTVIALYLTTDFGAWYGQSSLMVVVLFCAFAYWGFHLSLAGRPLFAETSARTT